MRTANSTMQIVIRTTELKNVIVRPVNLQPI